MENVIVTKNAIVLKKKQALADSDSRMKHQETKSESLGSRIREELASRGLIKKDEHGDDTPYYIEVKPQYVEIRGWTSQEYVTVRTKTGFVNSTCGSVMLLHYTQDSFDSLAEICVSAAKSRRDDTFFHSASELRWYLAHVLSYDNLEYNLKCENNQVIVSDDDGFLILDGAGHGPQPYLVDADGHRIDIKGDYEKPGVWPAIKRFGRRLDYGKENCLPYPITLDDLIESVENTMAEHGPGWQPVVYESLAL